MYFKNDDSNNHETIQESSIKEKDKDQKEQQENIEKYEYLDKENIKGQISERFLKERQKGIKKKRSKTKECNNESSHPYNHQPTPKPCNFSKIYENINEKQKVQWQLNKKGNLMWRKHNELNVNSLLKEEEQHYPIDLDDFTTPKSMHRYNTKLIFKLDLATQDHSSFNQKLSLFKF